MHSLHKEYISMAQARNILGFGGYQARTKEETKENMVCAWERERENVRISPTAATLGFLGSGKEAKKILSLSLYTLLHI